MSELDAQMQAECDHIYATSRAAELERQYLREVVS